MAEFIDRSKLEFDFRQCNRTDSKWTPQRVVQMIHRQPTADVAQVRHGRWVDRYGGKYANPIYECSECKRRGPYKFENDSLNIGLWVQDLTGYCPNCGARMDGGTVNEQIQ